MARGYARHRLTSLVKARRRGAIDRRTAEGRAAELLRQELTTDQGGLDNCSAAKLAVIDVATAEATWYRRIDRAIEAFIKKHPSLLDNPKGLALLYSYRERPLNAFLKAIGMVGFSKVTPPVKTLEELLAEDSEDGAE